MRAYLFVTISILLYPSINAASEITRMTPCDETTSGEYPKNSTNYWRLELGNWLAMREDIAQTEFRTRSTKVSSENEKSKIEAVRSLVDMKLWADRCAIRASIGVQASMQSGYYAQPYP